MPEIEFKTKIKRARLTYGFTCAEMSRICGFGPNQWRIYEKGGQPAESNKKLIQIILNPFGMLRMMDITTRHIMDQCPRWNVARTKVMSICEEILEMTQKYKQELESKYFN